MFSITWFLRLTTQMSWSWIEIEDMVKFLGIIPWLSCEHLWAEDVSSNWYAYCLDVWSFASLNAEATYEWSDGLRPACHGLQRIFITMSRSQRAVTCQRRCPLFMPTPLFCSSSVCLSAAIRLNLFIYFVYSSWS